MKAKKGSWHILRLVERISEDRKFLIEHDSKDYEYVLYYPKGSLIKIRHINKRISLVHTFSKLA
jgi:hypothetical protein